MRSTGDQNRNEAAENTGTKGKLPTEEMSCCMGAGKKLKNVTERPKLDFKLELPALENT